MADGGSRELNVNMDVFFGGTLLKQMMLLFFCGKTASATHVLQIKITVNRISLPLITMRHVIQGPH